MANLLDDSFGLHKRRSPAERAVLLAIFLIVGIQLWLLSDFWLYRSMPRVAVYIGALGICFVPAVHRAIARVSTAIDQLSTAKTCLLLVVIASLSFLALYRTALASDRQFTPIFHDEFTYLLQAKMFASGHLWLPAHPLGDFFETFYVITDRVYAAQYFPGSALLFVPGVWFHWAEWVMPMVVASIECSVMFLLCRELFGGAVGLASVGVLIGVLGFRVLSITAVSQVPAMLLAGVFLFALLRWERTNLTRWIVIAGTAVGWLAVTRPLEGIVCGVAGAVFVFCRQPRASWKTYRRLCLAAVLPTLPFISLQLVLNRGITGSWLTTPFGYYAQRDMPGTQLGFHGFDPAVRPKSTLVQKQTFYDLQVVPAVRDHTFRHAVLEWPKRRFFSSATEIFPDMLLVIVVPAALVALRDRRKLLVIAIMPLWWLAYTLHVFTFAHYFVFYTASVLVIIFAGFDGIGSCLSEGGRRAMRAAQVVMPIVISVMAMPQFKRDVRDQWFANPVETQIERQIARIRGRGIIMVRYDSNAIPEQEVVYNIDTAWPDDARVIRAQDLGERDVELYRYYAERQPDRIVYRFDRKDGSLTELGAVTELAGSEKAMDADTTRPTIGH